jgi:predicted metal-dependent phosphoesterase TrpH
MANFVSSDKKIFAGIIHIHTAYSHDGMLSLPDFVELAKKKHINFMLLSEHAEDFDDKKMQIFVNECEKITKDGILVIPGLEFNINDQIHILGIGIKKYINKKNPKEIIQAIHEDNGIAILAHVVIYKTIPFDELKDIDFIEIWNPRYGEKLSPTLKSMQIFNKFRKMKKSCIASGGLDFHKSNDFVSLHQEIFAFKLTSDVVLESLIKGDFVTTKGLIKIPALKKIPITTLGLIYIFASIQYVLTICYKILRKIYRIFNRVVK